jgi:hypothetical protein
MNLVKSNSTFAMNLNCVKWCFDVDGDDVQLSNKPPPPPPPEPLNPFHGVCQMKATKQDVDVHETAKDSRSYCRVHLTLNSLLRHVCWPSPGVNTRE